jgi:hypothetical protein
MAASTFHLTIWLSRNSVVKALPRPSKVVCRGRGRFDFGDDALVQVGQLAVEEVFDLGQLDDGAVGESLPEQMKYLPSGLALTPWGFFGTGT